MSAEVKESKDSLIMKTLEWAYENALEPGIPSLDSAYQMAQHRLKDSGTLEEKVDTLIRSQNAKSATSGFITGLGGFITLPVVIPADIATVLFIEVRMILAIAIMTGHDVENEKVKTLVYACLSSSATEEVLAAIKEEIGVGVAAHLIEKLSVGAITSSAGRGVATRLGTGGVAHFARGIPILGGIIWGTIDAVSTNMAGNNAKKILLPRRVKKTNSTISTEDVAQEG